MLTDNGTTPSNAPVTLVCPDNFHGVNQHAAIKYAVDAARSMASLSLHAVGRGVEGAAYFAIFKSHARDRTIIRILSQAATFPVYIRQRFSIFCVNTLDDVAPFGERAQDIYQTCQEPPYMKTFFPEPTVFVGTSFFRYPPEPNIPRPDRCPDVSGRSFISNSRGSTFPTTQSLLVFIQSLKLYGRVEVSLQGSTIQICNDALELSAEDAPLSFKSYYCFAERT